MGNAGSVGTVPTSPRKLNSSRTATSNESEKGNYPQIPFERLLDYVMPMYYTKLPLLPHEKEKLETSWKTVITNKGEGYFQQKREKPEETPCSTTMEFFSNRLMIRLIEVHPVCRGLITKTLSKLGALFLNMISCLMREKENHEAFRRTLMMIATTHTKRGVRATEFGIMGEVLFWTLRIVLGKEAYCLVTHTAWTKFYSRMLEVIVPVVLKHELQQDIEMQGFKAVSLMPVIPTMEFIKQGLQEKEETVGETEPVSSH